MRKLVILNLLLFLCAAQSGAQAVMEKLDRGIVATSLSDSSVYISWRMLCDDPQDAAFNLYRKEAGSGKEYKKITRKPVKKTTDFVDVTVHRGISYSYKVKMVVGGREEETRGEATVTVSGSKPYISIKLADNANPKRLCVGDLDGDGAYDFVIQHPNQNIDPYEKYWKRSVDTYKLDAYSSRGERLWRYDMGWGIETGTWYAPFLVYDIDGDGKAEVYAKVSEGDPRETDGKVLNAPEYLARLDPATGTIAKKVPWLDKTGNDSEYAHWNRNFISTAYLDGVNPALIMQRGSSYGSNIRTMALDKNMEQIWLWESLGPYAKFKANGSHKIVAADIDGDGKDELIPGTFSLDHDGKPLWFTGLKHNDALVVADIDPSRPGLEVFYGIEPKATENGMCLVDAKTGEIIWGWKKPTTHIHSNSMVADIDPKHPGMECHAGEQNQKEFFLFSSSGELIGNQKLNGLTTYAAWWDADKQKEIVIGRDIVNYHRNEKLLKIEGRILLVADILGDWREEIIVALPGEIRIYTTNIPARDKHTCLMQDRQYRTAVTDNGSAYYYAPQLGLKASRKFQGLRD